MSQDNVTLTGTTPLAKMFMNNMMVMTKDNIYDNILENSFVCIMDNSKFIKYDKFLFNVTGEIEDPQPKLDNKNLILMLNVENNETSEIQVQCNISNITRNNYILNCKANETFQGEIQSAISFIDNDDILLLNFANINDSIINIEETKYYKLFRKNGKNSLGAGAIVGIIVSILVAVALVTFLIFHFNKKNKKEVTLSSDSSAYAFKVADGIKY